MLDVCAGGIGAHLLERAVLNRRVNLNGSHVNDAFFTFESVYTLAADTRTFVWAGQWGSNMIGRADLDGTNAQPNSRERGS